LRIKEQETRLTLQEHDDDDDDDEKHHMKVKVKVVLCTPCRHILAMQVQLQPLLGLGTRRE